VLLPNKNMIEIILTKDGSHTLKNSELNETYHSIHGAVQESAHVFIKNGLGYKKESGPQEISILEVGFGTGLNAWLTLQHCLSSSIKITYSALEPFPLQEKIWSALNYAPDSVSQELFNTIHKAEWDQIVSIMPGFKLNKINKPIQQVILPASQFDIIYFDSFAPEKQPEMWSLPVLKNVSSSLKQGGIFVTYCAKGQVKRDLKSLGLLVDALPGPPGKREMIRATRI